MKNSLVKYGLLFIVSVILQVLLMNNIQFSGFVNPYIYLLFILLLPFNTPRYLLLLLGFALGLSVDMFSNTPGVHAAATVFVAFLRPLLVNVSYALDEQDGSKAPTLAYMGFLNFLRYAAVVVFIHHFVLFFVEAFSFVGIIHTLIRTLLSALFSLILIVISQYLIFRK